MDLVMGIDAGTQALKVGIFDCKGNLVSESRSSYRSQTQYPFPYWETQDPRCWRESMIEAICKCVNQSGINPERIKALGIDSTSSTLLMVDERGNPLEDALLWSDRRAVKQAELVQENLVRFGLHQGSGTAIPEMTLPKVLWLKENSPNYKKCFRIMEQGEWLIYQLTGEFTASRLTLIRFGNYLARIEGWPEGFLESSVALNEIFICGGNSESLLLTGILANVLNRPLHLAYPESSLLGSAICAAKGSGTYSSLEEAAGAMAKLRKTLEPKADACQKYDELFKQYKTRFKELVK